MSSHATEEPREGAASPLQSPAIDCASSPGQPTDGDGLRWRCWVSGCRFSIPLDVDSQDGGFCRVHHLLIHHRLEVRTVLAADAAMTAAIEAYCRAMGVRAPQVSAQAGHT